MTDKFERDSKVELVEALRKGAKGNARSKTARLRELIDEVEAAKSAGLSLKAIVSILSDRGLELTLGTFVNLRFRIKKEQALKNNKFVQPRAQSNEKVNEVQLSETDKAANSDVAVALVRPPGISDVRWSEIKAEARKNNRFKLN